MPSQSGLSLSPPGFDEGVVAGAGRVDGEHVAGSPVEERVEHELDVVLAVQSSIPLPSECHQANPGWIVRPDAEHDGIAGRDDADDRARARRGTLGGLDLRERRDRVYRLPDRLSKLAVQPDALRGSNTNRSALRGSVALGACGTDAGNEERNGEQRAVRSGHLSSETRLSF